MTSSADVGVRYSKNLVISAFSSAVRTASCSSSMRVIVSPQLPYGVRKTRVASWHWVHEPSRVSAAAAFQGASAGSSSSGASVSAGAGAGSSSAAHPAVSDPIPTSSSSAETVEALVGLIPELKAEGFAFGVLDADVLTDPPPE
ncbi:MAG TPA: hypothetical protein DCP20_03025 [Coriobacteriia bacterium]|nr:MAG: hypothetical protein XD74_0153 [Actinobacteria bacterium 66_15]HAL29674.1 hypothetical protein [Coriobacteriia bacterium]